MAVDRTMQPMIGAPLVARAIEEPFGLLMGEEVLMRSQGHFIRVTNQRVQSLVGSASNLRYVSISVDSVASCGLGTSSQPLFIVLAVISAMGALAAVASGRLDSTPIAVVGLVLAVLFVIVYLSSRRASLLVCSNGGERIRLSGSITSRTGYHAILDTIDDARGGRRRGERLQPSGVVVPSTR